MWSASLLTWYWLLRVNRWWQSGVDQYVVDQKYITGKQHL